MSNSRGAGGHLLQTIQDISVSLKELSQWRGEVDRRLYTLETTQATQQNQVDDLERESLIAKQETKRIEDKLQSLQESMRNTCTKFLLEIFLIILCIFGLIISIYYIIKK